MSIGRAGRKGTHMAGDTDTDIAGRGGVTTRLAAWGAALIAAAAIVNAYSYTLVASVPLIRSDGWRYLSGYLGRFLENGFNWVDVFRQDLPADTNQPLQKLFLFFHTRYFGMDFRLDAVLGILAGIALVVSLVMLAAGGGPRRWGAREFGLLAVLALTQLSLNSTELYTWPLATEWFVPLLLAVLYAGVMARRGEAPVVAIAATFAVGMLVDEFAYPVVIAVVLAAALAWRASDRLVRFAVPSIIGLGLSRFVYLVFNLGVVPIIEPMPRSAAPLLSAEVWKAGAVPLADSVLVPANVQTLAGGGASIATVAVVVLLAAAHLLFWWRIVRADVVQPRLTVIAATVMLLCYGLVLGVVIQRVPTLGFDYLHQPRYVMFYQLQLAALALLAYREWPALVRARVAAPAFGAVLLVLVALQCSVSMLAWKQVKYVSAYVERTAAAMGALAADPNANPECTDIMTVCRMPAARRAELIGRLQRYRMNLFSPDFQAFHRLYPRVPADAASPVPAERATPVPAPATP